MNAAFCFSNKVKLLEYYHNSSWLEHGGSPDKAVKAALWQIDAFLHQKNMYKKGESKIKFEDVQDCLIFVSSSFHPDKLREPDEKNPSPTEFIQQAMTEFCAITWRCIFWKSRTRGAENSPSRC